MHTRLKPGNLNGRDHFVDLGVNGRMILEMTLKKQSVRM
jgi:hypothetical protein